MTNSRQKHRFFSLSSLITGGGTGAETEAELARVYGRDDNGQVNVQAAAEGMGVTPRTVKSWLSKPAPGVADQLADVYGRTSRGRLDTKKAAADLGVSQRTVQRWAKTGKLPTSASGQQANQKMQAWHDSPEGRRAKIGERRIKQLSQGFKTKTTGSFQISGDRRGRRDVLIDVAPEQAQAMIDAYINGDDKAMGDAFDESASEAFGWGSVHVDVSSMRFF